MTVQTTDDTREMCFAPPDVYRLEIDNFCRAVRGGAAPLLAADEGLRNACVIEALLHSARAGGIHVAVEFDG